MITTYKTRDRYMTNPANTDYEATIPHLTDGAGNIIGISVVYVTMYGVRTELTEGTDYTIDGNTITTTTAYDLYNYIEIISDNDYYQETDYINGNALDAETLEQNLDLLTILTQQLKAQTARCIQIPDYEDDADMVLPAADDRAEHFLYFDEDGDVTILTAAELAAAISGDGGLLEVATLTASGNITAGLELAGATLNITDDAEIGGSLTITEDLIVNGALTLGINRAIRGPDGDSADWVLPDAATRAGRIIYFDASGNLATITPGEGTIPV